MSAVGGAVMALNEGYVRDLNHSDDPHCYHGEHTDEYAGLLVRGGVPVLAALRLGQTDLDRQEAPLVVGTPHRLPLDVIDGLLRLARADRIAAVIGDDASIHPWLLKDAHDVTWNPTASLDPFGDARRLRTDLMPADAIELSQMVKRCLRHLPKIDAPKESCVYFSYWKATGRWQFLLANVEPDARDVRVRLRLPETWLRSQVQTHGAVSLSLPDGSKLMRSSETTEPELEFSIVISADDSMRLLLENPDGVHAEHDMSHSGEHRPRPTPLIRGYLCSSNLS
jgi:hypothetical protein